MTATTAILRSPRLHTWTNGVRLVIVFAVLTVGSFALGRTSADTSSDSGSRAPAVADVSGAPAVVSDACGNAHQITC